MATKRSVTQRVFIHNWRESNNVSDTMVPAARERNLFFLWLRTSDVVKSVYTFYVGYINTFRKTTPIALHVCFALVSSQKLLPAHSSFEVLKTIRSFPLLVSYVGHLLNVWWLKAASEYTPRVASCLSNSSTILNFKWQNKFVRVI